SGSGALRARSFTAARSSTDSRAATSWRTPSMIESRTVIVAASLHPGPTVAPRRRAAPPVSVRGVAGSVAGRVGACAAHTSHRPRRRRPRGGDADRLRAAPAPVGPARVAGARGGVVVGGSGGVVVGGVVAGVERLPHQPLGHAAVIAPDAAGA